jgi:hypothetical protein
MIHVAVSIVQACFLTRLRAYRKLLTGRGTPKTCFIPYLELAYPQQNGRLIFLLDKALKLLWFDMSSICEYPD